MAKLNDITFNVGMSVSEDTMKRCCLLLDIYLSDHPELELISHEREALDGERYVTVYVRRKIESEDK